MTTPILFTLITCNLFLAVWMLIHSRQAAKTKREHEEFMLKLNEGLNISFEDIDDLETDVARLTVRETNDRIDINNFTSVVEFNAKALVKLGESCRHLDRRLTSLETELSDNGVLER